MGKGINKVIIVGNLGNDPEVKFMPSGGAVANISVAASESWKDKQTGEQKEKVEWHRIVFFNKLESESAEEIKKIEKKLEEKRLEKRLVLWYNRSG